MVYIADRTVGSSINMDSPLASSRFVPVDGRSEHVVLSLLLLPLHKTWGIQVNAMEFPPGRNQSSEAILRLVERLRPYTPWPLLNAPDLTLCLLVDSSVRIWETSWVMWLA